MDIFLSNMLYFLCFLSAVTSNPTNVEDKRIKTTYDEEETPLKNEERLEDLILAKYQVTENVIDVPDDRPLLGPLAFNYTFKKPLNIVTEPNNNEENDKNVKNTTDNVDLKRNKFSILHINADFDEQQAIQNNNSNDSNNNNTLLKGIKKYFYGIKKEIIKGINNWFHKNDNSESY